WIHGHRLSAARHERVRLWLWRDPAGYLVSDGPCRPDHPRHAGRPFLEADPGAVRLRDRAHHAHGCTGVEHAPHRCGAHAVTLLTVFRNEIGRVFALRPVVSVVVLAATVYAVFYPQPYLNEALRNVPIAVVDQDRTQTSRELARLVDATPDVAVTQV